MDVCGPMPTISIGGSRYFLTIIDDYSRKNFVFTLKYKKNVFNTFKEFKIRVEKETNLKIMNVRSDNGLEFCNNEFNVFIKQQGIKAERSNIYTAEQNGVSERFNLTALDCIKAMLRGSNLNNKFWGEALMCFSHVKNRICHKFKDKTPYELFCGRKPLVSYFKAFGCLAFVGLPKQLRNKLDMRAKLGVMVGYAKKTRGYRIWLLDKNEVVETSNVRFEEGKLAVENVLVPAVVDSSKSMILTRTKSLKTSGKSGSQDLDKPEFFEFNLNDEHHNAKNDELTPCADIPWLRIVPRLASPSSEVYYSLEGTKLRLRSHDDIKTYCRKHGIKYDSSYFNFGEKHSQDISPEANHIHVQIPRNFYDTLKTPNLKNGGKP